MALEEFTGNVKKGIRRCCCDGMKQVMRTTIPSVWCLLRIYVFFAVTYHIAATKLLFCDKPFFPVSLWFHIEWFLFVFNSFKVILCNMFF